MQVQKYSFISHQENHKNSHGEDAPWVIKDHNTGKIISSHKTKEDAESHLVDIKRSKHIKKSYSKILRRCIASLVLQKSNTERKERNVVSFFSDDKRKEILVWMWLNGDKDKEQIKSTIKDRFNILDDDAEKLFYEAFPDGITHQEEQSLRDIDNIFVNVIDIKPSLIQDTVDVLINTAPEEVLDKYNLNTQVQNQLKLVVSSLLRNRKLI